MTDDFYRRFEDRHRGSRELIKSRLRVYFPFIKPLADFYPAASCLDLGCGRGEWLELMGEAGIPARGVDLDAGMLQACLDRGLDARADDALVALRALPSESQIVVSGFHIAEHLPFSELDALVKEARRVLVPAGILILETPNPENLRVGTSSFYLDPTHQKPLPPLLLSFLVEYHDYARVKIVRVQEDPALLRQEAISLYDVWCGVSPDYAVVAQNHGPEALLGTTRPVFERTYGLMPEDLLQRFDHQGVQTKEGLLQTQRLVTEAVARSEHAESVGQQSLHIARGANERAGHAEATASQADAVASRSIGLALQAVEAAQQAIDASRRATDQSNQTEAALRQTEAALRQTEQALRDIHQSRSWRITAPLRRLGGWARQARAYVRSDSAGWKASIKGILRQMRSRIERHPRARRLALQVLQRFPHFSQRLRQVTRPNTAHHHPERFDHPAHSVRQPVTALENMTPHARKIFVRLAQSRSDSSKVDS